MLRIDKDIKLLKVLAMLYNMCRLSIDGTLFVQIIEFRIESVPCLLTISPASHPQNCIASYDHVMTVNQRNW